VCLVIIAIITRWGWGFAGDILCNNMNIFMLHKKMWTSWKNPPPILEKGKNGGKVAIILTAEAYRVFQGDDRCTLSCHRIRWGWGLVRSFSDYPQSSQSSPWLVWSIPRMRAGPGLLSKSGPSPLFSPSLLFLWIPFFHHPFKKRGVIGVRIQGPPFESACIVHVIHHHTRLFL